MPRLKKAGQIFILRSTTVLVCPLPGRWAVCCRKVGLLILHARTKCYCGKWSQQAHNQNTMSTYTLPPACCLLPVKSWTTMSRGLCVGGRSDQESLWVESCFVLMCTNL